MDDEPDGLEVARIVIVRTMYPGDIVDAVIAVDGNDEELGLAEALGMMRLAEDSLIRARMEPHDE